MRTVKLHVVGGRRIEFRYWPTGTLDKDAPFRSELFDAEPHEGSLDSAMDAMERMKGRIRRRPDVIRLYNHPDGGYAVELED